MARFDSEGSVSWPVSECHGLLPGLHRIDLDRYVSRLGLFNIGVSSGIDWKESVSL